MTDNPPEEGPSIPTDEDVDRSWPEFGGDARSAIRALLHDVAILADDYEATVSRGFVCGAIPQILLKRKT